MTLGYDIIPLLKSCPWGGLTPPTIKYCEENLCSWITAPANTWSNLTYFYAAWLIRKNQTNENQQINRLFFLAAVATGMGSFLYHASFTFMFQILDFIGMFMFSSLLLILNLKRLRFFTKLSIHLSYSMMVFLTSSLFIYFGANLGKTMFGIHIVIALLFEFIIFLKSKNNKQTIQVDYKWFKISLILFFMAYAAWWVDTAHLWCQPTNHFLQGHAIWHIINAFCFTTMAKFYQEIKKQISD